MGQNRVEESSVRNATSVAVIDDEQTYFQHIMSTQKRAITSLNGRSRLLRRSRTRFTLFSHLTGVEVS